METKRCHSGMGRASTSNAPPAWPVHRNTPIVVTRKGSRKTGWNRTLNIPGRVLALIVTRATTSRSNPSTGGFQSRVTGAAAVATGAGRDVDAGSGGGRRAARRGRGPGS